VTPKAVKVVKVSDKVAKRKLGIFWDFRKFSGKSRLLHSYGQNYYYGHFLRSVVTICNENKYIRILCEKYICILLLLFMMKTWG